MVRTEILVRQGTEVIADETTSTRYQLASVSKQFTAAAVLLLAGTGALGLDDRLGRWVDGCPADWQPITLHHLLTHTSGIGHWETDYPMIDLEKRVDPDELLQTFHRVPLRFPPGAGWFYSSPGYVFLAHVVERAGDTPYRSFLTDRIFKPLGLTGTFAGSPGSSADVASGHDAAGRPVPSWELDVVGMGAGDLWSTAADMLTWVDAVQTGRLLPEPYRTMMLTEHASTGMAGDASGYGYGVFTGTVHGRSWWQHSGSNAGFKAFVGHIPALDRSVVALSNTDATGPGVLEPFLEPASGDGL
jgi:CubicO group peptidase (beta-lactamase class C family)